MIPPVFATIVEGAGEVTAFRTLIYRIAETWGATTYPIIGKIWRVPKSTIVNTPGALESQAQKAISRAESSAHLPNETRAKLIILIDADDDCPADLGPRLRERLIARFPDNPISVSIANREYETWFIASLETIAEPAGINPATPAPPNVESIRGAKEWLSRRLPSGYPYKPTLHQAALSSAVDVPLARLRSQSFDRFCREVERLLAG